MQVRVEVTRDIMSDDGDDQAGRVVITFPDATKIQATWSATGGKGNGALVVANNTTHSDDEADDLVNDPDIYQGIGIYDVDIERDYDREPGDHCWQIGQRSG